MIKNVVYENIKFKVKTSKNELEILKTIVNGPFNKMVFKSAFAQIVKKYPEKAV